MKAPLLLVVEDNPDDEEFVLRAIRKSNIRVEVFIVRDGIEALDVLSGKVDRRGRKLPRPPLLVLLDLKMPRMGGIEFLQRLRTEDGTRHLPVVVFSSSSEERDIEASYKAGATSYVRKPLDWEQFAATIQHVGSYWLIVNRPPPGPIRA